MSRHLSTILAIADIRGEIDALERLLGEVPALDAGAVVVVGDLGAPWSKGDTYRAIFKALGESGVPTFWVPGAMDAPIHEYLPEAFNLEVAFPSLRAVHGTAAEGPDHVIFAGMGGEIVDDPATIKVEEALLRYPGWEVEYRLKVVRDLFKDRQKVFLFTTRPGHKGLLTPGSEVLAELIKTYSPRIAVIGGEHPVDERLGPTLVVCPGRLDRGQYAVIDVAGLSVQIAAPAEGTSA